jgi:hypothetical protein
LGTGLFDVDPEGIPQIYLSIYGSYRLVDTTVNGVQVTYPVSSIDWHQLVIDSLIDESKSSWDCDSALSEFSVSIRQFSDTALALEVSGYYSCISRAAAPWYWHHSETFVKDGQRVSRLVLTELPQVVAEIREEAARLARNEEIDSSCIEAPLKTGLGLVLLRDRIEVLSPLAEQICKGVYTLSRNSEYYVRETFMDL